MATPYIGEIRLVGFNFAPVGWAMCDGSVQSIAQNSALFQLLGTTYGGDGINTYNLPDLRSRVPIHQGTNLFGTYVMGQRDGEENVTLTESTIPEHSHPFVVSASPGTVTSPVGNFLGEAPGGLGFAYGEIPNTTMKEGMVAPDGGSQPHQNLQPFLAINYVIALFGIFPSQN